MGGLSLLLVWQQIYCGLFFSDRAQWRVKQQRVRGASTELRAKYSTKNRVLGKTGELDCSWCVFSALCLPPSGLLWTHRRSCSAFICSSQGVLGLLMSLKGYQCPKKITFVTLSATRRYQHIPKGHRLFTSALPSLGEPHRAGTPTIKTFYCLHILAQKGIGAHLPTSHTVHSLISILSSIG